MFCTPLPIIADGGTEFNNVKLKELVKLHKIKIQFTTTDHQSIVEIFHSTLIGYLRISQEPHPKENLMNYALNGYNSSIHSSTGFTPFEPVLRHSDLGNSREIFHPQQMYSEYIQNYKQKVIGQFNNKFSEAFSQEKKK